MKRRIALLLAIWPAFAGADMYRWTDEAGKAHFSQQQPPAGARNVTKIGAPAAPPVVTPATSAGSGAQPPPVDYDAAENQKKWQQTKEGQSPH